MLRLDAMVMTVQLGIRKLLARLQTPTSRFEKSARRWPPSSEGLLCDYFNQVLPGELYYALPCMSALFMPGYHRAC